MTHYPWKATHVVKCPGAAPRRVMLNSGALYTRAEWEENADQQRYTFNAEDFPIDVVTGRVGVLAVVTERGTSSSSSSSSSATPLRRPVTRLTTQTTMRYKGRQRRVLVTLLPGDVVELRLEGCRERRTVSVATLWGFAGKLQALRTIAARKAERAARRKGKRP